MALNNSWDNEFYKHVCFAQLSSSGAAGIVLPLFQSRLRVGLLSAPAIEFVFLELEVIILFPVIHDVFFSCNQAGVYRTTRLPPSPTQSVRPISKIGESKNSNDLNIHENLRMFSSVAPFIIVSTYSGTGGPSGNRTSDLSMWVPCSTQWCRQDPPPECEVGMSGWLGDGWIWYLSVIWLPGLSLISC